MEFLPSVHDCAGAYTCLSLTQSHSSRSGEGQSVCSLVCILIGQCPFEESRSRIHITGGEVS